MTLSLPRYENDQLVSIIGSKRPILGQLRVIFSQLTAKRGPTRFLDPFCGSGAVSRLARSMGMLVEANDWEPFSFILNHAYLCLSSDDLVGMFAEMGGIDAYLSMLNLHGLYASETGAGLADPYLSRYYAPQDDGAYDGKSERLFYTAANARFLDAVREEIELSWIAGRIGAEEKAVILASILFEASRKANTSGSFGAYLKQLGSSRARILEPCQLRAPVLPDANMPKGRMYMGEASGFTARRTCDICYLDPPSSVHQYGSAYHLLNSITLWDGYAPSKALDAQGRLLDRAGIRKDWKQTASAFCSLKHADAAFVHLFGSIDARHIVLTYPTSGIVGAKRIVELLRSRHAPVTVIPLHKANQGGRQGKAGKQNVEQVFVTGKPASFYLPVGEGLERVPLFSRLDALVTAVFKEPVRMEGLRFIGEVMLESPLPTETLCTMDLGELERNVSRLESIACADPSEALAILSARIESEEVDGKTRSALEKRAAALIRSVSDSEGEVGVSHLESMLIQAEGRRTLDVLRTMAYHGKREG